MSWTIATRRARRAGPLAVVALLCPPGGAAAPEDSGGAKAPAGVSAVLEVMRVQTVGDSLQVIEEIAVRNAAPSVGRRFEIHLPAGAQLVTAGVQTGRTEPVRVAATPTGEAGRYWLPLPPRAGLVRFGVAYLLPYKGNIVLDPKVLYPRTQFMVVFPQSMRFDAVSAGVFQPIASARPGTTTQATAPLRQGQPVAFRLSGTGTFTRSPGVEPPVSERRPVAELPAATPAASEPRVGTSLLPRPRAGSAAAASPGPLHEYRWSILGGSVLVLGAGVAGIFSRRRALTRARPPEYARGQA